MGNFFFQRCPRCGTRALERLSSHSHCIECLYFESHAYDSDEAYLETIKIEKELLPEMSESNEILIKQQTEDEVAS